MEGYCYDLQIRGTIKQVFHNDLNSDGWRPKIMKHIKRRLLALLLVVLQVVSIIPTNSFAQVSPISQVQITIDSTQAPGMWLSKHYYIVVGTGSDNYQYKHLNDNTHGTWTVNFNPPLGVNSGSVHVLLKYLDKNTWEPEPTDTEIKNTGHPTVYNLWNTWSATIDNDAYSVALQDYSTDDLTRYAFTFTSLNNPVMPRNTRRYQLWHSMCSRDYIQ